MENKFDNLIKLKSDIEQEKLSEKLLVFIDTNSFLTNQYIKAIQKYRKSKLNFIDDLSALNSISNSLFSKNDNNVLNILHIDDFKDTNKKDLSITNTIIVCKTIKDKETYDLFNNIIIEFPKVENWCIKDYVYSNVNISDKAKDWLLESCKYDLNRVDLEIDKLNIFNKKDQPKLFDEFISDNIFSDLSAFTIFDFTNAILTSNKKKILTVLSERDNIDLEPLGVLTLLYNNLRNIIAIQMNPSATPASLSMSEKQFNAIRYRTNIFSNEKLIKMFNFIITVDEKMKNGFITNDQLIDYILVNIL